MALLTGQNLALGYDGKTVVRDLSFFVNPGDYLCIVGENGTGKSTLIKTILRLTPPVGGKILTGDGLKQNEIGYLPQQTAVQKDFPASVREVVLSGCLNRCGLRPFYSRAEKRMSYANMEKLGVAPLAGRCYRELSGGQQQRVLLARALCAARKLLLLDEPASGLDPNATAKLYRMIDKLNTEDGMTVVMISHDIASAVKYASRILHIGNQKPLFFGNKNDYIQSAAGKAFAQTDGGEAE